MYVLLSEVDVNLLPVTVIPETLLLPIVVVSKIMALARNLWKANLVNTQHRLTGQEMTARMHGGIQYREGKLERIVRRLGAVVGLPDKILRVLVLAALSERFKVDVEHNVGCHIFVLGCASDKPTACRGSVVPIRGDRRGHDKLQERDKDEWEFHFCCSGCLLQ